MKRTRIFMPPLPRVTGGMAVLATIAEHLHKAGFDVALVLRETLRESPRESSGELSGDSLEDSSGKRSCGLPKVPVRQWSELDLEPGDIWLVPEGWPAALLPGLQVQARCVVYVQNWAYLLGNVPGDNLEWTRLPVDFLAVSDPVAWFIEQLTGKKPEILRPAIDPARFYPSDQRGNAGQGGGVRVAWMPRKNKALARQIRCVVEARNRIPGGIEWLEIHGLTQEQVAERLREADIFLATGFPEGCALPPLEALASGCVVAGYAGFGCWDYMRQIPCPKDVFPAAFQPWWPLRETTFGGNGFYTADADVPGAAMALEAAACLVLEGGEALALQRASAAALVREYSLDVQAARVRELWMRMG